MIAINILKILLSIITTTKAIPGVEDIAEQYCADRPTTLVDAIVMTSNAIIYVFVEDIFATINSVTINGLPVLDSNKSKSIRQTNKYWTDLPPFIDTAFQYNDMIYLKKSGNFWKHEPRKGSEFSINQIDIEKEFAFFKDKKMTENIVSISMEPNFDEKAKPYFIINYIEVKESDQKRYVMTTKFRGNSSEQVSQPISTLIEDKTLDLIHSETLVMKHWKSNRQNVLKALRFFHKTYVNMIYAQKDVTFRDFDFPQEVRLRSIGYNQVWLGCPQPMCLDSTVDTIVRFNNRLLAFRGRYFWNITESKPPLIENVQLISDVFDGLPSYLDASYYDREIHELFFFKEDQMYIKISDKWVPKPIKDVYPGIPSSVDAVFFISRKDTLFFFKDDQYYTFEIKTRQVSMTGKISQFSKGLPNYIDEVLVLDETAYVFKNWYYYKLDVNAFKGALLRNIDIETPKPLPLFKDMFFCPERVYTSTQQKTMDRYLEDLENFTKPIPAIEDHLIPDINMEFDRPEQEMDLFLESSEEYSDQSSAESPNSELYDRTDSGGRDNQSRHVWIFIAIIIATVIAIIIIFYILYDTFYGRDQESKDSLEKPLIKQSNSQNLAKPKNNENPPIKQTDLKDLSNDSPKAEDKSSIEQKDDVKDEISVTFQYDDDNGIDEEVSLQRSEESIEDSTQVPVPRVDTEPFLVHNPSLEPEIKSENINLFENVNTPKK